MFLGGNEMRDVILDNSSHESSEKKFLQIKSSENTNMAKLGLSLYILITLFYAITKIFSNSGLDTKYIVFTYLVLLVPMVLVLGLTFTKFGQKYIVYMLSSLSMYSGAYLCYMLVMFKFNIIYYIGLFFIFFSIYSLFNLGSKITHITGWSITIFYFVLYSLFNSSFHTGFIGTSIFLIGINGVGIASYYYREERLHKIFLLGVETSKINQNLSKDIEILKTKLHNSKEGLSYTIENIIIDIDEDFGQYIRRIKEYIKIISTSYAESNISDDQKNDFIDNICYAATFHKIDEFLIRFKEENYSNSKETLQKIIALYPNDDVMKYVSIIESSYTEFFDGSGSPKELSGCDIPIEARIMCAVDLYDEFTTARDPEMDHFQSLGELEKCSGSIIDPYIYDLFVQNSEKLEDIVASPKFS
jgi:hypothetical protein